jgi:hypothetical protein
MATDDTEKSKSSREYFWTTMPGCIAAIAGLITAVAGLITVLYTVRALPLAVPAGPTETVRVQASATSALPTEVTDWFVTFEYRFPSGYWQVGNHTYVLKSVCPAGVKDGDGSFASSFQVSANAEGRSSDVYLRVTGLRDSLFEGGTAVSVIDPAQSTVAVLHDAWLTHSEAEQVYSECRATVSWDSGKPQTMTASSPPYEH